MPDPAPAQPATRPRLALAIPTYCRAEAIAANLAAIADEARRTGTPIYISDDSPDDETRQVAARYPDLVTYRKNEPRLGHDRNLIDTLLWPDADNVWLLGDALRPHREQLAGVIDQLGNQDLTFLNTHHPAPPPTGLREGNEVRTLLRQVTWHQSLTGATIYNRTVIDWVRRTGPQIYRNFPQLSVILGFCSTHPARVFWRRESTIHAEPKASSYWRDSAIEVFVTDWSDVICANQAAFGDQSLHDVLRSHSRETNLFNPRQLAELRMRGRFLRTDLKRPYFRETVHIPQWQARLAMVAPRLVLGLYRLRDRLKGRKNSLGS